MKRSSVQRTHSTFKVALGVIALYTIVYYVMLRKVSRGLHLGHKDKQAALKPNNAEDGIVDKVEVALTSSPGGGTYPRLTKLPDASILASFTRWQGKERVLRISRSTDGGRNFLFFGEVTRSTGDLDNLFLLATAPSTVMAAFRNHDLAPDGSHSHFRITICQSTDGGKGFTFLSQAAEKGAPFGLWEPFPRIGAAGEVQLFYAQELAPDDQRIMRVDSHDQGKTWTNAQNIVVREDGTKLRDGMAGIAETKDDGGKQAAAALVMILETTRYGTFSLEAVVSYDDGATWTQRQEVYAPPTGHNAGAPQIASFGDGSLAVVFMTDEDSKKVEWTKYSSIKVIFSRPPQNGKMVWSKPQLVSPESSYWPGIMALDENTALAVYDRGGPRGKKILWNPK
ncbi:hypothetical protein AJ80_01883 [Polytolypa hystricis UAMH7299]|uniref:Sialidase domain-containing protein n=1 Tax=Polytolypa hystricis (strain UAMH7299) TaxID=1447883 RepID=A0A2B7YYJ2_POLH7|nr:hypothetical protein AJ80_01883 [Polytolypa hystricis UAMH7299]